MDGLPAPAAVGDGLQGELAAGESPLRAKLPVGLPESKSARLPAHPSASPPASATRKIILPDHLTIGWGV